ncbi:MAG: phosphotransferase [Pseudomonadota bacterium]
MPDLEARCKALVLELGLGRSEEVSDVVPLTGGVASDIARFTLNGRILCAKFALEKLKVAEDWRAPVHRNSAEYSWLQFATSVAPENGVPLYGQSKRLNGFVMDFIGGEGAYLWKAAMLAEAPDRGEAAKVADLLGRLQLASTEPGFDASDFRNQDDFFALRIEPYLTFTASVHDDLKAPLLELANMLFNAQGVLVHGDVSPKNILIRPSGPVLLDAECATLGDASFDPAFCMNHLILKAVHLPNSRDRLLSNVNAFWEAYNQHISFERPDEVEKRVSRLLPALMLARVDGKSPVEYLSAEGQRTVRDLSRDLIRKPVDRIADLVDRVRKGAAYNAL